MKTFNSVTLDNCTVVFLLSKYNLEVIRAVAGNDKCADCGSPGKSKNIKDHLLFLNCTVNVETFKRDVNMNSNLSCSLMLSNSAVKGSANNIIHIKINMFVVRFVRATNTFTLLPYSIFSQRMQENNIGVGKLQFITY